MANSLIAQDTDGTYVVAGSIRVDTYEEAASFLEDTNVWSTSKWKALQEAGCGTAQVHEHFGVLPSDFRATVSFTRG